MFIKLFRKVLILLKNVQLSIVWWACLGTYQHGKSGNMDRLGGKIVINSVCEGRPWYGGKNNGL